jgi:anti-anti-sigma factor
MPSPTNFRIETSRTGARKTILLAGDLDSATCTALADEFERTVAEPGLAELHLDLRELSFVDSAGMRVIILIERAVRERGLALLVTPPPQPLVELLQMTGVANRLTLATHQDELPQSDSFVERVEVVLPSDPSAPARARAEIRQAVAGMLSDYALDAAILMTSELVTNAVVHPQTREGDRVGLRITRYEDRILCEISDAGPGFDPAGLGPREPETGGRGLLLVESLSSRWGTDRQGRDGRFSVWFELEGAGGRAAALEAPGS